MLFSLLLGATTTLTAIMRPAFAYADVLPPTPIVRQYDETACNCYLYVKGRVPNLPSMKDVVGSTTPAVGAVAIFEYRDKDTDETVKHIAIVGWFDVDGFQVFESNFDSCKYGKRFIKWNDPHIRGFAVY